MAETAGTHSASTVSKYGCSSLIAKSWSSIVLADRPALSVSNTESGLSLLVCKYL